MRILVVGKNAQLGKSIYKIISAHKQINTFIFVNSTELNLNDKNSIASYFNHNNFDIIINCAAYTAVDKAESEQELANQINHLAVKQLAEIAGSKNISLIHISTDYVFNGNQTKPYTETDQTYPINIYGQTKLAGELAVQKVMPTNAVIIRTSWLYSEFGNNFVTTTLRLGKALGALNVVSDQTGSPTYATDLAEVILDIISKIRGNKKTSVYHYSNQGSCSWYEFAQEIFKLSGVKCRITPIQSADYPTLAKRPNNTLMNKDRINRTFFLNEKNWIYSLDKCIKTIMPVDTSKHDDIYR